MLRTVWVTAVTLAVTLVVSPIVAFVSLFHSSAGTIDALTRFWSRAILWSGGVRIEIRNPERVRPEKRYVVIANHQSYFDIPCLLASVPQPLRFMAKKSLFSIPLFGWAIGAAGFIPIDRKNRSTAVKSFDLAAERIRKGNSIVVFPEEGRSRTRAMRPFKRGAFLLALRSDLTLLPIAIYGTFHVLPARRWSVKPAKVTLVVGEEIDTAQYSIREKDALIDSTRETIYSMLAAAAEACGEQPPPRE
jgi:1-acyl-sn-glycerol-3-phosphate acyltransferase